MILFTRINLDDDGDIHLHAVRFAGGTRPRIATLVLSDEGVCSSFQDRNLGAERWAIATYGTLAEAVDAANEWLNSE